MRPRVSSFVLATDLEWWGGFCSNPHCRAFQALKVQTSTLKSVSALVRELNGQRESLMAILDANKVGGLYLWA